jgi:demethylmenaquinone methyltransferase/2-methoxy-6-polyprenyl-1,4-benzoquinol methylase
VRELFAGIAPRYALVNRVASAGLDVLWRREVVRALALAPGDWCLDACCGTGDLSRAIASSGARVLGVDFCRPMLLEAGRAGGARVGLAEGDALRLPAATGAFGGACVAFGLRNLSDPRAGLRELARVTRPGGRVAVLEFSEPPAALVRAGYRLYSRHVLPLIGDLLSGRWGTYRYLPQTIAAWLSPGELARAMAESGLRDVRWRRLSFGIVALHVGTKGD